MIQVSPDFRSRGLGLSLPFRPACERSSLDPNFPFGQPQEIDYGRLDQTGIELIKEINRHPWMATIDYCSGHPSDRPATEDTPISDAHNEIVARVMPGAFRWDFWDELRQLTDTYREGKIDKSNYLGRKAFLTECSKTTFSLRIKVMAMKPFMDWMRMSHMAIANAFTGLPEYEGPRLTIDPMKRGLSFHLQFDYYGTAHRKVVHDVLLSSLREIPI